MAGAAVHRFADAQHLINDFVHLEGTLQASLAGGTEATGHRTAHLTADTDREPIITGDADGFEAEAVARSQEQFGGAITGITAVQQRQAADVGALAFTVLQRLAPGLGQDRDRLQAAGPFGIDPVVQLAAAKGRLALALGPVFEFRQTEAQQRNRGGLGRHRICSRGVGCSRCGAHWNGGGTGQSRDGGREGGPQGQIRMPWPSHHSTATRAMKPSMAMRPCSSSLRAWKPQRGRRRTGIGVPSSVRAARGRWPLAVGLMSVITEQTLLLQTLECRRIGDQLFLEALLDRRPGKGGETAGAGLDAVTAASGFQIRVGGIVEHGG